MTGFWSVVLSMTSIMLYCMVLQNLEDVFLKILEQQQGDHTDKITSRGVSIVSLLLIGEVFLNNGLHSNKVTRPQKTVHY